ncbi:MAG: hypothetical protein AB7P03_16740 [Kofleriaceae bacterium]
MTRLVLLVGEVLALEHGVLIGKAPGPPRWVSAVAAVDAPSWSRSSHHRR